MRRRDAVGPRYWMLETIREFAAEQLETLPSRGELRRRHAEAFAELAEKADRSSARAGPAGVGRPDRRGPRQRSGGLRFGLDVDPAIAARIIGNLAFFVWLRGGFAEARQWVDEALARSGELSDSLLGHVHEFGSVVCERMGDVAAASRHADDAYAAFVRAGDEQGMADALRERGKAASCPRTSAAASDLLELATLAERIGDRWNGAIALNNLGDQALQAGDWPTAVELCTRSSEIRAELGDRWGSALALSNVATAKLQMGEIEEAAHTLERALRESLAAGATMVVAACLDAAVLVASARRDTPRVAVLIGAANRLHEELRSTRGGLRAVRFTRSLEEARAALGDETFEADVERGETLSLEEAASTVLRSLGRPHA